MAPDTGLLSTSKGVTINTTDDLLMEGCSRTLHYEKEWGEDQSQVNRLFFKVTFDMPCIDVIIYYPVISPNKQ